MTESESVALPLGDAAIFGNDKIIAQGFLIVNTYFYFSRFFFDNFSPPQINFFVGFCPVFLLQKSVLSLALF
jgi:hypothetical protein